MSQPIFLNTEELLDIIFAELPDGPYPTDRADDLNPANRSYSSSELRAHSELLAMGYLNLQNIWLDKFAITVTPDGLPQWEKDYFSTAVDGSFTYIQRQQNLISKIRAGGGISVPIITNIVHAILDPIGLAFAILPYSGQYNDNGSYGAWVFEYSQLDWDTWLSLQDPLMGAQRGLGLVPLNCAHNYAAAGINLQQMLDIEATAYTYEVQIYGNADAQTLSILDQKLTEFEPARSTHVIRNNMPMPPY